MGLRGKGLSVGLLAFLALNAVSATASGEFAWFPTVIAPGPFGATQTSLAIDALDRPHVTYFDDANGTLEYAVDHGTGWQTKTVDRVRSAGGPVSLALDPTGRPRISYFDGFHVRYAAFNGTSWNVSVVDVAYEEGANSLALGRDGLPRIAYAWDTGSLRFARWDGSTWIRETVETNTLVARYVSLVLDSIDRPHIAYYGNGLLRYAWSSGQAWTVVTLGSVEGAGWFSRLALDPRGWPRIAYRDSSNEDLRFAAWDGTRNAWTYDLVDSEGDTGWDIGFALDGNGDPHISYYERLGATLRYARKVAGVWEHQTVDAEGIVGWYTSLALNATGFPFIAYYDWTRGAVRVASARIEFQVRSVSVEAVSLESATLRGELACLGAFLRANISFEWRATGSQIWNRTVVSETNTTGVFRQRLENLTPATDYEFRLVGVASGSAVYGDVVRFRTASVLPIAPSFLPSPAGIAAAAVGTAFLVRHVWKGRRARLESLRGKVAGDEVRRP